MNDALDRLRKLPFFIEEGNMDMEDDGPEPIRADVREIAVRVAGRRLFVAVDEDGELCGFGLLERGAMSMNLTAKMSLHTPVGASWADGCPRGGPRTPELHLID